jgi:hypothetical protein
MGEFQTTTAVDARTLGYATDFAPLTITGPDAGGVVRVESPTLSDAQMAAAVDVASRTLIVDNGDGTGTRTTYDEHGNETSVKQVTGLPIPEPVAEPTDPVALLVSALRDPLANLTASSASTTVRTAILNQRAALDALLELYR